MHQEEGDGVVQHLHHHFDRTRGASAVVITTVVDFNRKSTGETLYWRVD